MLRDTRRVYDRENVVHKERIMIQPYTDNNIASLTDTIVPPVKTTIHLNSVPWDVKNTSDGGIYLTKPYSSQQHPVGTIVR